MARPRRRRRRLVLAGVAALAVAAGVTTGLTLAARRPAATVPSGRLQVGSDAALTVSPASAGCNTTFVFVGRGSLSGAGMLAYRWEQSDGQLSPEVTLPVHADEASFQLTQAWRLQGEQVVEGSMTLHVLAPVDRRLRRGFHYGCP